MVVSWYRCLWNSHYGKLIGAIISNTVRFNYVLGREAGNIPKSNGFFIDFLKIIIQPVTMKKNNDEIIFV